MNNKLIAALVIKQMTKDEVDSLGSWLRDVVADAQSEKTDINADYFSNTLGYWADDIIEGNE